MESTAEPSTAARKAPPQRAPRVRVRVNAGIYCGLEGTISAKELKQQQERRAKTTEHPASFGVRIVRRRGGIVRGMDLADVVVELLVHVRAKGFGTCMVAWRNVQVIDKSGRPVTVVHSPKRKQVKKKGTNKKGEKAKSSGMEGDPFIEIDHGAPPAAPLFNPGDGFDVYIDAGRFLPDNTTIPKVVARVMTHDLEFVAMSNEKNQETAVCDLTDNVFNPQWKLRLEYRRGKDSAEKKFDPTSTLNIRVETIEELSKKVEVIGYCALNVFCKPGTADAPDNPSEREYVLNKGAHQLPLFYGAPNMKSEWSVHNLEGHPHVPCATLLVRIESAAKSDEDETKILSVHDSGVEKTQWEELGLLKPFKGYKEGDYDSQRCLPTETEKALYEVRRKQEAKSLRDRAIKAKRSDKVDKWDEKTVSDEDLQKWCTERTNQKPTDMLHPQGMVIYNAEAGPPKKSRRAKTGTG